MLALALLALTVGLAYTVFSATALLAAVWFNLRYLRTLDRDAVAPAELA